MTSSSSPNASRSLLLSIGALTLCCLLWPAVVTFDPGDWPSPNQFPHNSPPQNACGIVGAWLAYQLLYRLGDGVYPLLLFITLASLVRLIRGHIGSVWERLFGLALLVLCASASAHLISQPATAPLPVGHGGVLGYALGELLTRNLDRIGTMIVLASSLIVGLLFATEGWVLTVPAILKRVGQASGSALAIAQIPPSRSRQRSFLWWLRRHPPPADPTRQGGVSAEEKEAILDVRSARPGTGTGLAKRARKTGTATARTLFADRDAGEEAEPPVADVDTDSTFTRSAEVDSSRINSKSKRTAKRPTGPIVRLPSLRRPAVEPYPRQIENWRLPSIELLHEPQYGFGAQQELLVRKQAQVLERTLEEFRLDARVVQIDTGPVITMFELKLGAGIKVSQIATLSNDIARALKAHAIRVVAPISGKNTVGIEVPNSEKEIVRLRELMTLAGKSASELALPLFLGKDAGGTPLIMDLTQMPHLLIAGTTGSGKSVCLNAITLSLLMTKRPDHVKLILIDPKMVEMSQFKDVPHLMCPIVTDVVQAQKILAWAVTQMDERYDLLAEARVKNIGAYNNLGAQALYARLDPADAREKARVPTRLPYIVIIIDELADLMMTAGKEVEHHMSRLAQKSRAVGVHIIVATQRPEAKIVTGLVKSNLPSRICFRVASRMDSRIVLDQNGGEVLLGQGDMLFLPPGSHKLIRGQGTFLDDGEVRAVLEDLASRAQPDFHPDLVQLRAPGHGDDDDILQDPLFDEAARVVLRSQRGSVSLLQRRLTIGYSRASRLIDQMAEAGIVGEYKGSQARSVIMTLEQWDALRGSVASDGTEGKSGSSARYTPELSRQEGRG